MPLTMSINSMPPEVLMIIFHLLPPEPVTKLQIVCRIWRNVLHSMRELWTDILLVAHTKVSMLDGLSIASRRSSRSGTLPLTILWKLDLKQDALTDEIKQALREFLRNAPFIRWAHLVLWDTSGFLDEFLDAGFSSLENLSLEGKSNDYDPRVLEAIDRTAISIEMLQVLNDWDMLSISLTNIINRVKSVDVWEDQDVRLELPKNVAELKTLVLPRYLGGLQNITHLILDRIDRWLMDDNELLSLEYLDVGDEPYHEQADGVLSLPNLLHLKIPGKVPFLLAGIDAPKLLHLRLQEVWSDFMVDDDLELDEEEVTNHYQYIFQAGDFPSSIKTLRISYPLKAELFWNMLQKTPNLRKLDVTVRGFPEANALIRSLNSTQDHSIPEISAKVKQRCCPDLALLTIRWKGDAEIRDNLESLCHTFFQMRSSAGFKRLRLIWEDRIKQVMTIEKRADEESSEEDSSDGDCDEEE